jgi:hypothetical protein
MNVPETSKSDTGFRYSFDRYRLKTVWREPEEGEMGLPVVGWPVVRGASLETTLRPASWGYGGSWPHCEAVRATRNGMALTCKDLIVEADIRN